ncbi:glucans biosynthesis glucosyltransferase MdoH [uncultured Roseovarius sp.]|uniref:glucans biosynthesis glucosyltransferase MdoH n=1 Tax=uncultured Roseovarius sp. TaxID=293344 RepID=UPI0026298ED8|nr:glucans biosynthesis glucosyltransferase MdoH [uncultured Roseovarius sp.]
MNTSGNTSGSDRAKPTDGAIRLPRARRGMPLPARRRCVLALNTATVIGLFWAMYTLFAPTGITFGEGAMLGAFLLTLPWLSIGLWNSVLGLLLDLRHGAGAAARVTPAITRVRGDEPITARIAVVMPLRNEDPDASIARLRRLEEELALSPWAGRFSFHVLSDTNDAGIALKEEARVAQWRSSRPLATIHYRRRTDNAGYKAGNIAEFLHSPEGQSDFFLPLDADSEMGAETVLHLIRVMQASPEIGMLQSLVTGLPSRNFFTRAFQFGMRHGMRSYTLGSAWWQGDCGPNWGHNLVIRTTPFRAHCMLPLLPGRGPLSGAILSHDQVEAVLMRRAGYEVRVLAEESDSHEDNPPSLVDFIRRELRWMNGNLQYVRLLGLSDLKPVSRIQLVLAILMYISAPAWIVFILIGASLAGTVDQMSAVPLGPGLTLFAVLMTLSLSPKLMGLAQVLFSQSRSQDYGGRLRVVSGGLAEILFSMLTSPIVAVALTQFALGLVFGQRIGWSAQQRSRDRLGWDEAARVLWPQTLLGLGLCFWLGTNAPWALIFGAPVLLALVFSIPIAVVSTLPRLSRWSMDTGLFDIPEDRAPRTTDTPAIHANTA